MNSQKRKYDAMFFRRLVQFIRRSVGVFYHKSYSQCGEDLIVNYIFNALEVAYPTYLDIGAHHPRYLSNTYLLYRQGCRGVNVEPDPMLYRKIKSGRRRDTNLNVGMASERGSLKLHVFSSRTLNTFSEEEAVKYVNQGHTLIEKHVIDVLTFEDVVSRYFDGAPDFVSLDVEGMDVEILQSIDFARFRPTVFCVETITYSRGGGGKKLTVIDEIMAEHGYLKYADTYINTIYVLQNRWEKVA
ncbi:FkbM family methyltransferase [Mariprofundus ferrooxydans]|uniref:FkbM family methyltransferase n=1 Tax=Mariprofundus ferrooxydans TaxID=314344 RepID=UPI0014305CA4|nr:FkbM family methyltransferase [Mariprofundus ferrooxydans]